MARPEGARKYTVGMILSFGPAGTAAWALGLPRSWRCSATWPRRWSAPSAAVRHADDGLDRARAGDRHRHRRHRAPIAGARFGFAPALSATMWLVLAVYAVESRFLPLAGVRRTLALLGRAAVPAGLPCSPGELRPHALSRWAPLHWVLGIASYGLFGAAVLHAAMLNRAEQQMRHHAAAAPAAACRCCAWSDSPSVSSAPASSCCRRRCCSAPGSRSPGAGTTRRCSPCSAGGVRRAAGPGWRAFGWRGPLARAGSMAARRCCCWPTSARASCSRSVLQRPPTL